MKVIDILNSLQKPFASFELVPPLKGSDVSRLYDSIDPLMQFQPPFINITCHRDEVEYVPNGDGSYKKMTLAKRPSTIAIVAAIMRRYPNLEIVPHVICGGASQSRVESELLDLHFLGIQNVVALRGDAIPGQRFFIPEPDGFSHSSELVAMIRHLNGGQYLDPTVKNGLSTDFCVGVAAYPEKHFEAANLDVDIQHLKQKVEAGAVSALSTVCARQASLFLSFLDSSPSPVSDRSTCCRARSISTFRRHWSMKSTRPKPPMPSIRWASNGPSNRAAIYWHTGLPPSIIIRWQSPIMCAKLWKKFSNLEFYSA